MRSYVIFLMCCLLHVRAQLFDLFGVFATNDDIARDNVKSGEYDFVIVGAGSGGSVVANRLSENANWTVLLLEAGREESFLTDVPIMAAMQSSTSYNWGYKSEPSNTSCLGLSEGRCTLPRGKALGGTSVINFLLYTRGNKMDFDDWASRGNKGWSYKEVLPYFKKSERCSLWSSTDKEYHGFKGDLHVQHPPYQTPLVKYFLKAGRELGYGVTDPNGRKQLGFSKVQATMEDGRRCSVAKAFLDPIKQRPNLKIVTKSRATRILIDPKTKQAMGIEFLNNRRKHVVRIKKEVILCAGAINSPHLLMLSGIGPKENLEKVGIPLVKDLKVGYNLQDHVAVNTLVFLVNQSVTILDENLQNPADVLDYVVNGKGPFTLPGGAEAVAFLKTQRTVKSSDYPDVEIVLGAGGLHGDTYGSMRRCLGIPDSFYESVYGSIKGRAGFSMSVVLMRAKSSGRVVLKDSNPLHWPVIRTGYFREEDDVDVMVEGIKKTIALANTKSFQRLNATLHDVPFPGCERLPFGDDTYWRCVVRHMATTLGHQVGTCKMGPKDDPSAVVDDELRVHGIGRLRVVDGSIMPNVVAGHTNSVIVMIGEKASDLIKSAWK